MAIYYVRKTGSDAAAGTSAGAAWLTIGKALGAAGIASGDTVYVGAGVYREIVTVNMTSATVETKIIGDVDGSKTGDAGEVQLTAYLTNDVTAPSGSTQLTLNARDFLTFQDIVFIGGNAANVNIATANSTDINFTRCLFVCGSQVSQNQVNPTTAANVAANWTWDSCTFLKGSGFTFNIILTRPATADFDYNIVIKNCLFIGGQTTAISVNATGANTFNGGGVVVRNCTHIGGGSFVTTQTANLSTTIPAVKVYNCFVYTGTNGLVANTAGHIVEDYNLLYCGTTPRNNTTAGAHSISSGTYAPLFYAGGHEAFSVGSNLMPFGMPKPGSPILGFDNQASSPVVDIIGAARPSGFVKLFTGTATAGAAKTITDSGKTFGTDALAGTTIKIISGTGSGQTKSIASNTATVITVDGNWKTNPSTDSVYEVYSRATSSSGKATAVGAVTTMTDANAAWGTNQWAGYTLEFRAGTGSPQTMVITSNTATVITFPTIVTACDTTTEYWIYRGTSENIINAGVGCYEYGESAIKETTTVRTGSNAIRIPGAGYNDFVIPVSAVSTTVTVYTQWDAAYSGTKPSMSVLNGTEAGVANATNTATGSSGSWEQLSLTFTPTAAGIVTVRVVSSSTTPTGNAFFDDFNVT